MNHEKSQRNLDTYFYMKEGRLERLSTLWYSLRKVMKTVREPVITKTMEEGRNMQVGIEEFQDGETCVL